MSFKVFVTREIPPASMDILKKCPLISEIKVNPHDRVLTRQELEEGVKWCDALMCQLTDTIDDSLLA
jgi:hypothetical protein